MLPSAPVCYRALQSRDARFDGRLFVAVRTTGIYCRPICPARTPKLENIRFFATAAGAQEAGFRPCLRCRPESAPELAAWRGTSSTVSRALALIADGALEGDGDVESLAARLGIGDRHLRRLFDEHLGASPLAVAHTRRVLFAKKLIHETDLKMAEIALASGFGSIRRFNGTFQKLFARPPSAIRRERAAAGRDGITLRLAFAPPYDWDALLGFFAARAIPGVERVEGDTYRRTIALDGVHGTIEVRPQGPRALSATIRFPAVKLLPAIVVRIRRMFDLGSDVESINRELGRDHGLATLVRKRPGLRVPGAWDGFELGIRAVLGQQVTVVAARGLAAKLVERWGEPLAIASPGLERVFPTPQRLSRADLSRLGMPGARIRTLGALARAAASDPTLLCEDVVRDREAALTALGSIPGIGDWTAHYIALRALRDPDAFPASDIGLLRGAQLVFAGAGASRPTPAALLARAEAWRPWRAYAAQHLWAADSEHIAKALHRERAA